MVKVTKIEVAYIEESILSSVPDNSQGQLLAMQTSQGVQACVRSFDALPCLSLKLHLRLCFLAWPQCCLMSLDCSFLYYINNLSKMQKLKEKINIQNVDTFDRSNEVDFDESGEPVEEALSPFKNIDRASLPSGYDKPFKPKPPSPNQVAVQMDNL